MSDLRAACIHGRYEMHGTESTRTPLPDGGVEISNLCNGGRDITIDYEAMSRAMDEWVAYAEGNALYPFGSKPVTEALFAAAVGDTK